MSKHSLEEAGDDAVKVDTTLYDLGVVDRPTLVPAVITRDKELQATIEANRARRARQLYGMQSLAAAGLFLMSRGENFDIKITVP